MVVVWLYTLQAPTVTTDDQAGLRSEFKLNRAARSLKVGGHMVVVLIVSCSQLPFSFTRFQCVPGSYLTQPEARAQPSAHLWSIVWLEVNKVHVFMNKCVCLQKSEVVLPPPRQPPPYRPPSYSDKELNSDLEEAKGQYHTAESVTVMCSKVVFIFYALEKYVVPVGSCTAFITLNTHM